MDPFIIALKDRGIPEENLNQMAQDKVDLEVVRLMDDGTLSKYIPHFGDRVYARNWTDSSSAASNNEERKRKLIEHLRSKMKLPSLYPATTGSQSNPRRAVGKGNKNAERKTRKIELGWMVYQNGNFKQVRRPTGGGTRELIVSKDDTVNKILEDGKQIFFPKGKSSKGRVEDFDFSLCIMGSEEPLDATLTVGRLYDTTYHKLLRLYICSKPKKCDDSVKRAESPERFETAVAPAQQDLSPISSSHSSLSSERPFTSSPLMTAVLPSVTTTSRFDQEVIFLGDDGNLSLDVLCDTLIYQPAPEQQESENDIEVIEDKGDQKDESAFEQVVSSPAGDNTDCRIFHNMIDIVGEPVTEVQPSEHSPTNSNSAASPESPSAVPDVINPEARSNHASPNTLSASFYDNAENIAEKQTIAIRKVHCVSDMIQTFSDENILYANITFERVLENGQLENGVGHGLVMDCLTDFWGTFYETRTCGATYKIPTLHHAYQELEWKAVARILAFGWQRFQYLPVQLAPPFLYEALSISSYTCNLMEAFFNYISPTEKDALTEALSDFRQADLEELLTILSSHNCTSLPTKENLLTLLKEIAHKEMVQEPAFIIKCWQPVLKGIGESLSGKTLEKILDDLQPKPRNITKFIQFPKSMSPIERTTSLHLLRFVREIDQKEIGLFLRFCTGSDLFLAKTINVTFKDMSEFTRRPVAHTCSCALELACSYSSFSEFRSEFLSVLKSGIWVMDMV